MCSKLRKTWDEAANEKLRELMRQETNPSWKSVARKMHEFQYQFTSKQCKVHWKNVLDPSNSQDKWSVEEEALLFELWAKLGNKWSDIADALPGRSEGTVKNRFYSTIRRIVRKVKKEDPSNRDYDVPVSSLVNNKRKMMMLLKVSTDGIYQLNRYKDSKSPVYIAKPESPVKEEQLVVGMEKYFETSGVFDVLRLPVLYKTDTQTDQTCEFAESSDQFGSVLSKIVAKLDEIASESECDLYNQSTLAETVEIQNFIFTEENLFF